MISAIGPYNTKDAYTVIIKTICNAHTKSTHKHRIGGAGRVTRSQVTASQKFYIKCKRHQHNY